jgi:hypothetical protein
MVPIIASASPQQLECAPQGLAFGATVVGQTETLPVTLTNGGNASATISGVTASNSGFTASSLSLPLTLLPGQSIETTVNLHSHHHRLGRRDDQIYQRDAANSILPLPVGGTGVFQRGRDRQPVGGHLRSGSIRNQIHPACRHYERSCVESNPLRAARDGRRILRKRTFVSANSRTRAKRYLGDVAFSPTSAATVGGSLFFPGVGLVIPLNGIGVTPGQLIANPASLSFGSVQSGSNTTLTDSFTNTGGTSVTITSATVTGAGFSITGLTLPMVLFPGASVTFYAQFEPQGAVSATGGIAIVSNASNRSLNVSLSGASTALGQLTVAPTALNFGNTTVGTTVSQASSLSASGSSVTVSSATLSSPEFSITGISLPMTIPAGQSVPVTVTFAPQTSGTASAVLSLTSKTLRIHPPRRSVGWAWRRRRRVSHSPGQTAHPVLQATISSAVAFREDPSLKSIPQ